MSHRKQALNDLADIIDQVAESAEYQNCVDPKIAELLREAEKVARVEAKKRPRAVSQPSSE